MLLGLLGLGLVLAGAWRGPAAVDARGGASLRLVVAVRNLEAGTIVAAGDVSEVEVGAADALSALAHSPAEVVGRRLAVAVPSGAPLGAMLLTEAASLPSGHRLVRLPVDAASLPPDAVAGAVVDVLAAVAEAPEGARVVSVARGRVVAVAGGGSPVVTLDVEAAGASRLLWAQTFAKSVRLLARPSSADDAAPPDVSGLDR